MTTPEAVQRVREHGDVIWENRRYESLYVVDRPELLRLLSEGIPVVHLGQLEAITAVLEAEPAASWLTIYVHTPRDIAVARIAARRTNDDASRLRAWDETRAASEADLFLTQPRCHRKRLRAVSTPPYAPSLRSCGHARPGTAAQVVGRVSRGLWKSLLDSLGVVV